MSEYRRLKRYANRLGARVTVLSESTFNSRYAGVEAFYDPHRSRVCLNRKLFARGDDYVLFALAHEIGHAVDHYTDDEAVAEYRLNYDLASVYSDHGLELPRKSLDVFREREVMATTIGESILRELRICIGDQVREEFKC